MTIQYQPKNDEAAKAAKAYQSTLKAKEATKANNRGTQYPGQMVSGYVNPVTGKAVPTSEMVNYWVNNDTGQMNVYKLSKAASDALKGVTKSEGTAKASKVTTTTVDDRMTALETALSAKEARDEARFEQMMNALMTKSA